MSIIWCNITCALFKPDGPCKNLKSLWWLVNAVLNLSSALISIYLFPEWTFHVEVIRASAKESKSSSIPGRGSNHRLSQSKVCHSQRRNCSEPSTLSAYTAGLVYSVLTGSLNFCWSIIRSSFVTNDHAVKPVWYEAMWSGRIVLDGSSIRCLAVLIYRCCSSHSFAKSDSICGNSRCGKCTLLKRYSFLTSFRPVLVYPLLWPVHGLLSTEASRREANSDQGW